MSNEIVERYQISGLDERERGFSRLMDIERVDGDYHAVLRYEKTIVETEGCDTSDAALSRLISLLHERGFSQLRSRLNFHGAAYLGSQQPWIEYPDPSRPMEDEPGAIIEQLARRTGWIGRVLKLFGEQGSR
jgi:hypothetical protein